jgi:tRNA nucleotidyltransferase (CCA-adding enzyme)
MIAMENDIEAIKYQILKKIKPQQEDKAKIEALIGDLEQKIALACKEQDVQAIIRVEGSMAKGTWLREEPDVDIFVRLPISIPRKELGNVGLRIAKKATAGLKHVERFAEHPYLETFVSGYRVHIVPCYNVEKGEWKSATDRTPFHTDYIKKHLSNELQDEIRILKKFLQGINAYGAEIKIGGFSGYLSELLVLNYGSFTQVLTAFAHYKHRIIIDIEGYYENRVNELKLLFPEHLVVVDPVDKARNVASAVHPQKLYTLVGAAREFLKKSDAIFFYPPETKLIPVDDLKDKFIHRGASTIFLVVNISNAIPDVLWGQLFRSRRSLRNLIEINDYKVLKDAVWSNEKDLCIFIFELATQFLANIKKHVGPPLELKNECESFLSRYVDNEKVISGPSIEENHWVVQLPRKHTDAVELLKDKLEDGGKTSGVADLVAKSIQKKIKIFVNHDIVKIYQSNNEFAEFLSNFIVGKPFWLKTAKKQN